MSPSALTLATAVVLCAALLRVGHAYSNATMYDCNADPHAYDNADVAFFTVLRAESAYVEEFVMYHLFIGVDVIYIYDNEDEPTYRHLFPCNPRVKVVHFPWTPASRALVFKTLVLRHWMEHFNHKHRFAMHIDGDDFVVLKQHTSVRDLAMEYLADPETSGVAGLALEWVRVGSGDRVYYEDKPLVTRFTGRALSNDRCIKTLFACDFAQSFKDSHQVRTGRCELSHVVKVLHCAPAAVLRARGAVPYSPLCAARNP